ncbi:hypothetical protein B0I35DRAFT_426223 [Stachybotrys elegans]|uniref:Uncharacterized protein n=1 Tax=Stachybotrys elegans TaxID=80388 RepID=A0A8K0WSX2_9HYPO|nr:hypothetical protein B0I35DRAFT_426223 [Stachybotrys elegans]
MCYQLLELYSACRCAYYQHAIDRCAAYGRPNHHIQERTIYVGYPCPVHSSGQTATDLDHNRSLGYGASSLRPDAGANPQKKRLRTIVRQSQTKFHDEDSVKPHLPLGQQTTSDPLTSHPPEDETVGLSVPQNLSEKANGTTTVLKESRTKGDDDISSSDNDSSIPEVISEFDTVDQTSQTSATSLGGIDALDNLSNRLIFDSHLQYLWPQFISRASSLQQAQAQISSFISRYSLDLLVLAETSTSLSSELDERVKGSGFAKLAVAKFMLRKRRSIAENVCRYFWLPELDFHEKEVEAIPGENTFQGRVASPSEDHGKIQKQDENGSDEDDEENALPAVSQLTILNAFLFDSEPFQCFRETVQAHVERTAPLPMLMSIRDRAEQMFNNFVTTFMSKKPKGGQKRLLWTCACGSKLYDDYQENRPGALDDLKALLASCGVRSSVTGDLESNSRPPAQTTSSNSITASQLFNWRKPDLRLPRQWQRDGPRVPGKCNRKTSSTPTNNHNYVLACIPLGRWVSKLRQPEACMINSDQDFFSLLRIEYFASRTSRLFLGLRRVKAINFVKMELFQDSIADIRSCPSLPPEELKTQYLYDPMPADIVPPIGPNVLVHLFDHPSHAAVLPLLYKRIPKKLQEKLVPCVVKGSSLGWGIEVKEGLNMFVFFLCGCAGFILCLAAAISWTVGRSDIQGGVGIGSFMMAFVIFCGGMLQSHIEGR